MGREEFDDHFIAYRTGLREEVMRFRSYVAVYRQINEKKRSSLPALNLAPAFFQVVEGALFSGIVLWGDKLLDEKGQRGFFNFLTFIEHNRKWLSVKQLQVRRKYPDGHWMLQNRLSITLTSINADRQQLRQLECTKSFKLRRDKFHGHFDKDYFFDRSRLDADAPLKWADLEEAGTAMMSIINTYSVDFDGKTFAGDPINISDLDNLLNLAAKRRAKRDA